MKVQDFSQDQSLKVSQFMETTSASQKQAIAYLLRRKWDVQAAVNSFFDDGTEPEGNQMDSKKINELFMMLNNPKERQIDPQMDEEQLAIFLKEYLNIDQNDLLVRHLLVNIMEVPSSGHIRMDNFKKLFVHCGVSDPKALGSCVTKLKDELKNKTIYGRMYHRLFKFYLIKGETTMYYDYADALWRLYLEPIMPLYKQFVAYLDNLQKKPLKVNEDLWKMMYLFATNVSSIQQYQEKDAWPVFIDDFMSSLSKIK